MASCQRIETGSDAERDLISELPVYLKERILESLPTRDAARTAFLSTHWKDVWLRHGRLAFDWDFVRWLQECQGYDSTSVMNIINNILLLRVGPVKKFTLQICYSALAQTEIDKWCLFLSRNGVQELNMSCLCPTNLNYKMPFCIVSCQTIKHLKLQDFLIDLPVNGGGIFPMVTSLVFERVLFKHTVKGNVFRIPKLEKLTFRECDGIQNFDISAPKLRSFSQFYTTLFPSVSIPRWFTAHLETIKYLCLSADLSEVRMNLYF
nr:F-box/FBD/LRR-repeat protein At1g13570-like [Ipomoea batatas]